MSAQRSRASIRTSTLESLLDKDPLDSDPLEPDSERDIDDESESLVASLHNGVQNEAIVITGICGRMGRLLARRLHRERPVIGIDRRSFDGKPEDIVHHQIDLRRRKTRDIFRAGGIRAVVHLGVMHDPRESDRTHHEWNVVGFQKLLEYCRSIACRSWSCSRRRRSTARSPDNAQFLTEEAPLLGAQDFSQIRDLVEVDMLAQSFFWKHPEIETVILRPCHILGPRAQRAEQLLPDGAPADGDGLRSDDAGDPRARRGRTRSCSRSAKVCAASSICVGPASCRCRACCASSVASRSRCQGR